MCQKQVSFRQRKNYVSMCLNIILLITRTGYCFLIIFIADVTETNSKLR